MKLYLFFKRKQTQEGHLINDEVTVVPVEVPDDVKDCQLVGSTASIHLYRSTQENIKSKTESNTSDDSVTQPIVEKFECGVPGTAKLSRYKGMIRIGYRRGKATLNQTAPNSVCINNSTKQVFFDATKNESIPYCIQKSKNPELYKYWSSFMDQEYIRQFKAYQNHVKNVTE